MAYPLVKTDWLAAHLNDADVRVVDIRGHVLPATEPLPHYFNHYDDYAKCHIRGAAFIDWVKEITDPADPRHAKIATPERYRAAMRRIGINDDTLVIAYDDASGMFAARLWWSLRYFGHERTAILHGGWQKWSAEGRPVSTETPAFAPGNFTARANRVIFRDAEQVERGMTARQILIDVRSPAEFRGEASRAPRFGHIPGAINVPRTDLLGADGELLPDDVLRAKFAALGIGVSTSVNTEPADVVFYCNGGVSASFGLLAMNAAGIDGGAVYDGSWKDWGNDPDKPVER